MKTIVSIRAQRLRLCARRRAYRREAHSPPDGLKGQSPIAKMRTISGSDVLSIAGMQVPHANGKLVQRHGEHARPSRRGGDGAARDGSASADADALEVLELRRRAARRKKSIRYVSDTAARRPWEGSPTCWHFFEAVP